MVGSLIATDTLVDVLSTELRAHAVPFPPRVTAQDSIRRTINHTQDVGLAFDAIVMFPRPLWLLELIGTAFMAATSDG